MHRFFTSKINEIREKDDLEGVLEFAYAQSLSRNL